MSTEPTPAEIAAQTPEPAQELTPAEIAMQGLEEAKEATEAKLEAAEGTPEGAPPQSAEEPATEPATDPAVPRYSSQLEALMTKARAAREEQVAAAPNNDAEELKRLRWAQELAKKDPNAAYAALGIERPKLDINKILNPEKDNEPQSVKELKAQMAEINGYMEQLKEQNAQQDEQRQQMERQQWEQNEVGGINKFIDESKEKYQYVGAAKEIGSDKDIYNGMVSMYNQGYSPSYDEMADLVESRIEQLLDLVAPTTKFASYIGKKFGVKLAPSGPTATLTSDIHGEPAEPVDFDTMTDEENQAYAMKQALAAAQKTGK